MCYIECKCLKCVCAHVLVHYAIFCNANDKESSTHPMVPVFTRGAPHYINRRKLCCCCVSVVYGVLCVCVCVCMCMYVCVHVCLDVLGRRSDSALLSIFACVDVALCVTTRHVSTPNPNSTPNTQCARHAGKLWHRLWPLVRPESSRVAACILPQCAVRACVSVCVHVYPGTV